MANKLTAYRCKVNLDNKIEFEYYTFYLHFFNIAYFVIQHYIIVNNNSFIKSRNIGEWLFLTLRTY